MSLGLQNDDWDDLPRDGENRVWTQPKTREQLTHMIESAHRAALQMWQLHKENPENEWYSIFMNENKQTLEELKAFGEAHRFRQ